MKLAYVLPLVALFAGGTCACSGDAMLTFLQTAFLLTGYGQDGCMNFDALWPSPNAVEKLLGGIDRYSSPVECLICVIIGESV